MKAALCITALGLTGCTHNSIERLIPDGSVVKHATVPGYTERYSNLYGEFTDYPVTCDEQCYPATTLIQCRSEMEQCQYLGQNPRLNLHAEFDVTWFGHASFLINTANGQSFLFDPVSKQFDWPVNWAFRWSEGFFRNEPNNFDMDKLNDVDAVMYSHIHYDHFNKEDISKLGNHTRYLTPLGFADHFENSGYQITEMAWYASKTIGEVTIHFVPAQHFSSRIWVPYLHEDNNATLWGGWILERNGKTLYFAGDTGYSPHFQDIAQRFGSIDVCLLPIASYHSDTSPKWYRKVHTTPEDALIAAKELNCKAMVPWGYGNNSWKMGDLSSHSALFRLLHMENVLDSKVPLVILNEGERVQF